MKIFHSEKFVKPRRPSENLTDEELAEIRREHHERLENGGFIPLSSAETGPEHEGRKLTESEMQKKRRITKHVWRVRK
jgi:hypothetical protein